ncbi:CRP-like cAMP-binding protein [Chitinophaga niastensis]|uniref:CRP-like cAMP-binding protein n=1 Tax=Chitinophaga niastensis TaxID=536980 RepID=A0A2P8HVU9_CHINA|nr:Crp/Fnr family transcriptional regulator [Chitinophaga niastensis]PSL50352.1 CRP-like cAMP-binding protein [Chitinophaga niastensis]
MTEEEKYLVEFKEKILKYYPISDKAFHLFKNIISFHKLDKGTILLNIGQVSKHINFICKGAMIAFFTDNEGNTYNKNIFLERQFAGSAVSALLKAPSEFTLQAIEDTTIIRMNYSLYKELIYKNDELKSFYIAYLEKNWIIDKEQREISLVMENATTRYQKLLAEYPNIDKRIPLQHIASHLAITPTQLSRIRKNLKKKDPNQHM